MPSPVHTDDAPAAIGPYSQAVVSGGFVFTAGQIALDPATMQIVPGGVAEQTDRVMHNLAAVLEAAGSELSRARSGLPRISDRITTTPRSAPTMTKSQRTTLVTTASIWSFGRAC